MEYKGYIGSVEFSESDSLFYGKVLEIRSLISYEGNNESELIEAFHGAVDDYLIFIEEDGTSPEMTVIMPSLRRRNHLDEFQALMDDASRWAEEIGMTEDDITSAIKSVRARKKNVKRKS